MKIRVALCFLCLLCNATPTGSSGSIDGIASWYGEAHRGKLMANGETFNPDNLTAASWFHPFGTRLRVTARSDPARSIVVTVTDRGPARRYVEAGRIIDLSLAAFKSLADPGQGLLEVTITAAEPAPSR